jgi:phosphodiesterase/alkaline phosphatase D-like protein
MDISRREFLKESLAALGFAALPGGFLFAAPPGWKRGGRPNIVFGVVSDTHLRTAHSGNRIGRDWPDKYFVAALEYFKAQGVDAVVHCGDMAHRGQVEEMQFHANAWNRVFGPSGGPSCTNRGFSVLYPFNAA